MDVNELCKEIARYDIAEYPDLTAIHVMMVSTNKHFMIMVGGTRQHRDAAKELLNQRLRAGGHQGFAWFDEDDAQEIKGDIYSN